MRRTRYLTIALLIFSITSAASASQCSDRHLEEFSSQGGKDAWLKRMRGVQSQAKQALRTGVWSDGEKLSNERLRQIREAVQDIEEDIAEAAACSLPGQSASTSSPTRGNPPAMQLQIAPLPSAETRPLLGHGYGKEQTTPPHRCLILTVTSMRQAASKTLQVEKLTWVQGSTRRPNFKNGRVVTLLPAKGGANDRCKRKSTLQRCFELPF